MLKAKIAASAVNTVIKIAINNHDKIEDGLKDILKDSSDSWTEVGEAILEEFITDSDNVLDRKINQYLRKYFFSDDEKSRVKQEIKDFLKAMEAELTLDLLCDDEKMANWLSEKYERSMSGADPEFKKVPEILRLLASDLCDQYQESKDYIPKMLIENRQNIMKMLRQNEEHVKSSEAFYRGSQEFYDQSKEFYHGSRAFQNRSEEYFSKMEVFFDRLDERLNGTRQQKEETFSISDHNKAEEFRKKWDTLMFLEDPEDENHKTLGAVYVLPDYKILKSDKDRNAYHINRLDPEENPYTREKNLDKMLEEYVQNKNQQKRRLLVIFGAPGIGKSTLLVWMLAEKFKENKDICLFRFAEMEDIEWKEADTNTILQKMLSYMGFSSEQELTGKVLLWDGFDEITATETQRSEILQAIQNRWMKYCPVIVTCRENYIQNPRRLDLQICHILLKPFTRDLENYHSHDQIREFQIKYKGEEQTEIEQLLDADSQKDQPEKSLEAVFGIPLFLYMILSMQKQEQKEDIPKLKLSEGMGKAELYERIFQQDGGIYDRIIQRVRYDNGPHNQTGNEYVKELMQKTSGYMAFSMFSHRTEFCYETDAKAFINEKREIDYANIEQREERHLPIPKDHNEDLSGLLSGGFFCYVENNQGKGEIRFIHRSLYEFFSAIYMSEYLEEELRKASPDEDEICRRIGELFSGNLMSDEILQYFFYHFFRKYDGEGNAAFKKNLKAIAMWEHIFEKLLMDGMTSYRKNTDAMQITYKEHQRRECCCFVNLIRFLQEIRKKTGHKNYFPEKGLGSEEAKRELEKYLDLAGRQGMILDIHGFYLQGLKLAHGIFEQWGFGDANLEAADFHASDLKAADLSGTNLKNSCFRMSNLEFANLTGAKIENTDFQGTLLAGIQDDTIRKQILHKTNCGRADFVGGNVQAAWKNELLPGNLYSFGRYKQGPNGEEKPILWQILDIQDGEALLISDKILEGREYHKDWMAGTSWQDSDIRKWLNDVREGFLGIAFSDEERKLILEKERDTEKNPFYEKAREKECTCERIFLLSYEEAVKYWGKYEKRNGGWVDLGTIHTMAYGTEYARKQTPLYVNNELGTSWWWLRSGGSSGGIAMLVLDSGSGYVYGDAVHSDEVGIRPALWIRI